MKMSLILALALAASASAFQTAMPVARGPAASKVSVRAARMGVSDMEGISAPVGLFDPLGFSDGAPDDIVGWYRHAELKHGRVAMAAFVGWIVQSVGVKFPGMLDPAGGLAFKDMPTEPLAAWDAIPEAGKWQILSFIGMLEIYSECADTHYTVDISKAGKFPALAQSAKGGPLPNLWDPLGLTKNLSEEAKKTKRLAELNNGRLAMIGTMGFVAAGCVKGAVPALPYGGYNGNPFAPFEGNFHSFFMVPTF